MTQSEKALITATTDALCFALTDRPAPIVVEVVRQVLEYCDGVLAEQGQYGELARQINAVTAQRLETGRWRGAL